MASEIGFEAPTWNQIYEMLVELAERIRTDGFKPDILVEICRGGWFPMRVLSDLLENRNIASVGAEFYVGIYETSRTPRLTQPISVKILDKRILLVDDLVDSGRSAELVKTHLVQQGAREVKILTLYYKPWSVIMPDFYSKETHNWVVFPWEIKETLRKLAKKCQDTGESFKAAIIRLTEAGVSEELIRRLLPELHMEV